MQVWGTANQSPEELALQREGHGQSFLPLGCCQHEAHKAVKGGLAHSLISCAGSTWRRWGLCRETLCGALKGDALSTLVISLVLAAGLSPPTLATCRKQKRGRHSLIAPALI